MQLELYSGHKLCYRQEIAHAIAVKLYSVYEYFFARKMQPQLYSGHTLLRLGIAMLTAGETLQ